jgi:LysM repeat protein
MKTMVGYESGAAGVGVASNDTTTFITLNVRPGDSVDVPTQPGGTSGSSQANTPIPLVPVITATMRPDGAIIHEVGYGQSLWSIAIAYGVTSARIRELNGMAPNDSAIWAGQRLLIVPAGLATPTI